jgi:hypothetical protein
MSFYIHVILVENQCKIDEFLVKNQGCNKFLTMVSKIDMPDITMCKNKECSLRDKCYRFMSKPSMYQSYADFKHGSCEYFILKDESFSLEQREISTQSACL